MNDPLGIVSGIILLLLLITGSWSAYSNRAQVTFGWASHNIVLWLFLLIIWLKLFWK